MCCNSQIINITYYVVQINEERMHDSTGIWTRGPLFISQATTTTLPTPPHKHLYPTSRQTL